MSSENDLIKLYSERILALATELSAPSRLDAPDGSIKKRSPLCGSAVTVDVKMEDGKISSFAQEVKACALGQAAALAVMVSPGGIFLLNVKLFHKFCIFLDILKPQFRFFAHQLFHQTARFAGFIFVNIDPDQFPAFGVHRGFF